MLLLRGRGAASCLATFAGHDLTCQTRLYIAGQQNLETRNRLTNSRVLQSGDTESKTTDDPVWVRREKEAQARKESGGLPFGLWLFLSVCVAIAAVRSASRGIYLLCIAPFVMLQHVIAPDQCSVPCVAMSGTRPTRRWRTHAAFSRASRWFCQSEV